MSDIERRKIEHIELALDEDSQSDANLFKNYLLPYSTLPEIDLGEVDTSAELFGKKMRQPLIIGSMTSGAARAETINANLAVAAERAQVALGVGSQRIALELPEARENFEVIRRHAPSAVIFANMGAIQLNYGRTIEDYKKIVDMVRADGLYLHLNPLQETLQPEGDTNFKSLFGKIEMLVKNIGAPVFIKEVGHGLDPETCRRLIEAGAAGIDIAGVGGTSWGWIEARRSGSENFTDWFKEFGYPTDFLLREISEFKGKAKIVASGGIRTPIQGLKAHLLGAGFYSAARPFLAPALKSAEAVYEMLMDWEKGLRIAMFAIGAKNWEEAGVKKVIEVINN